MIGGGRKGATGGCVVGEIAVATGGVDGKTMRSGVTVEERATEDAGLLAGSKRSTSVEEDIQAVRRVKGTMVGTERALFAAEVTTERDASTANKDVTPPMGELERTMVGTEEADFDTADSGVTQVCCESGTSNGRSGGSR